MQRLSAISNLSHQNFLSQRKIPFQTKLKIRGTNETFQKSAPNKKTTNSQVFDIGTLQNIMTNKSYSRYEQKNLEFHSTCNLLSSMNFSHHDSAQCLCNECSCGRHLCKMNVIKPDLRKSTVYQNSFQRSKSIKNSPILKIQENRSLPKVEMNSTYSFSFRTKDTKNVVKHHPEDQLRFQGPSQKLTSYHTNFPGNRGDNPYVRPKQVYVSGEFPLRNKRSAYRQSYNKFSDFKKTQTGKINDQLKTGNNNLFRESFYQQKFKSPNPEDYPSVAINIQKLELNPDFTHQYETSYDNQFIKTQPTLCPAKIKLETSYKDAFTDRMKSFAQNSDFKALSSTFHALSTAPYRQYQ